MLDTNVLVSALLAKGESIPKSVLYHVLEEWTPVFNGKILQEYQEVLSRPKFPFSQEEIQDLIRLIEEYGQWFNPDSYPYPLPDEKDRIFYETWLKAWKPAWLVSGNLKHFPRHEMIVSPREFYDRFIQEDPHE